LNFDKICFAGNYQSLSPAQDIDTFDRPHQHVRLWERRQFGIGARPFAPAVAQIVDQNDVRRQLLEIRDQPPPLLRQIGI